jgi:galactokinase/mevalonate kinase-like predicted kinase
MNDRRSNMKKRACRMTEEEKAMHNRAVKLKKMTDAQLCDFIDRTYGKGMEEGAKAGPGQGAGSARKWSRTM